MILEFSYVMTNATSRGGKPWIIKYLPSNTQGVIGRDSQLSIIQKYLGEFPKSKTLAILLCGPPGCGKTSVVQAIAAEKNLELFEINASDTRNKSKLQELLLPAVLQKSFFYDGKIVLIDEVDGISGNSDRGGMAELATIIQQSKVPIILTANNIDTQKFKPLLKVADIVYLEQLATSDIITILSNIAKQEDIDFSQTSTQNQDDVLRKIALLAAGDARAAINDLQLITVDGNIDPQQLDLLIERDKTQTISHALGVVFKTSSAQTAYTAMQELDDDLDTQFSWMDYNIAKEYTSVKDLARAYSALAKADVFRGRIRNRQEWRLFVYAQALLSGGVATAKDAPYKKPSQIVQTTRGLSIWQANMATAKRKQIAIKLAAHTHSSFKRAYHEIPFLKQMAKAPNFDKVVQVLDLSEDEVQWLKK